MVSVLMARSSDGKDVKAEKSKVCEWVKLPTPSTDHMHPSCLGVLEVPDAAGAFVSGAGVGEDWGAAEAATGAELEEPQLPKAD